ncbi:MAG: Glycogen synthase [Fimbriimonadaceae bacterium]|nr:Glycogen synthase [Fimbriimonadaceae bacterium]
MRVLVVSAEVAPFAKVGGLADVAASLPRALNERGQQASVAMPGYPLILNDAQWAVERDRFNFSVSVGSSAPESVAVHVLAHEGVYFWLIDSPRFRTAISSDTIYSLDRDAYLLFSEAVLALAKELDVHVVHANDWHTGFVPVLMRERYPEDFDMVGAVFSIHNLAYQGEFGSDTLTAAGLPMELFNLHQLETFGAVNFLKAGCVYSDEVNTVSPTYAREIMWPQYGCRLEGLMWHLYNSGKLRGILNGIDTDFWNPATDTALPSNYSLDDLSGKQSCKEILLQELGLDGDSSRPLFGMVSRLSWQKGFDLVLGATPAILELGGSLVVQGLGDPGFVEEFKLLESANPGRVKFVHRFDAEIANRIYAGSDFFLMPSAFEPCGLGQMIAMRYVTIPIVRATGGLADTVREGENGFVLKDSVPAQLIAACERAVTTYRDPEAWSAIRQRAGTTPVAWDGSASAYIEMYRDAIACRPRLQVAV